jgi:hypothetical protein
MYKEGKKKTSRGTLVSTPAAFDDQQEVGSKKMYPQPVSSQVKSRQVRKRSERGRDRREFIVA